MKSLERLVFNNQRRYANRFGDGFIRNAAIPFTRDLLPGETILKLFEDNPHHDPCPFERGLAAAYLRIGNNVPP